MRYCKKCLYPEKMQNLQLFLMKMGYAVDVIILTAEKS